MRDDQVPGIIRRLHKIAWGSSREHFWITSETDDELHCIIILGDIWYWASGEAEELTPENIGYLEQAYEDIFKIDTKEASYHAMVLWACRINKMRPMEEWYKYLPEKLRHLFDACGSYRGPKDSDAIWTGIHDPPKIQPE